MTGLEPWVARHLVSVVASIVFALALMLGARGALADPNSDCDQVKDVDRTIRGCTQIIERGKQESRKSRVRAYNNRGNAYIQNRECDHAIADYTKDISLNLKYAEAYNNRGAAYAAKGETAKAKADLAKAEALRRQR